MHVQFSTPTLSNWVSQEYLLSALRTEKALVERGIGHEWTTRPGDPFIAKARSTIACAFLETDSTDLFFLDDDIGWPMEAVFKFLESDVPVIAGVYPMKQEDTNFPCSLEGGTNGLIEQDGLFKAVLAPTGFMRIKRWVIEKLHRTAPPYRETDADGTTYHRRAIFNSGPAADGNWWGEDYAFCNACREHDIGVWIDPDIPFYHRGTKRWGANMADSLEVFRTKALDMTRSDAA